MTSPAPTAVHPGRVLILDEHEQTLAIEALYDLVDARANSARDLGPIQPAQRLINRLEVGDEYDNPVDELVRTTLRKRKLEAELRRVNGRLAELDEMVVEELAERGEGGVKHAATGATVSLTRKVWAKVCRAGEKVTDDEKAAAAEGLVAAGLGDFVKPGFNTNTVSAYFREQVKAYDADQRDLPEHERVPRTAASFLPPELVGLIDLDDTPTTSVRAS